ncbi:tetraacyldisaccharide 4'-kinase [bacterium]|nr:tetraacyldisaccharide 4'-kinase [bacterium]
MSDINTAIYNFLKPGRLEKLKSFLACINKAMVFLRWLLYNNGILPSHSISHKVISIGNLTVGGTGKTVTVEYIANKLLTTNKNLAILTRGYGRRSKGTLIVPPFTGWEQTGDEPYMLAQNIKGIPIVIDRNRIRGALQLVTRSPKRYIFILDDGFQFLKLNKDVNIVLLDANDPLSGNRFFPAGRLRDGTWRLNDADIIVLTKAEPGIGYEEIINKLKKMNAHAPVFIAEHRPINFVPVEDGDTLPLADAKKRRALAFAGIADPKSFLNTLTHFGVEVAGVKWFLDHHKYTQADIDDIRRDSQRCGAEIIVTTQKDAVKLTNIEPKPRIYYLKIGFKLREEDMFWGELNALL